MGESGFSSDIKQSNNNIPSDGKSTSGQIDYQLNLKITYNLIAP